MSNAPASGQEFLDHLKSINFQLDGETDHKRISAEAMRLYGRKPSADATWEILNKLVKETALTFTW